VPPIDTEAKNRARNKINFLMFLFYFGFTVP